MIMDRGPQHAMDEDDVEMDCGNYPEFHGFSSSTSESGSSVSEDLEPAAALGGFDCPKNDNQVRLSTSSMDHP